MHLVTATRRPSTGTSGAPGAPGDDARRAWAALVTVFTSDEHQQQLREVAAHEGLTPGELKALITYDARWSREGAPMRSLAEQWHCDASHVTQLVDALESAGLAERRTSAADRRVKLVVLTARGRRTRTRVLDALHSPPAVLDVLTPTELARLAALLEKVAAEVTDGFGLDR